MFDRAWPFMVWAGVLVLLSAFVYKSYCRYRLWPRYTRQTVLRR